MYFPVTEAVFLGIMFEVLQLMLPVEGNHALFALGNQVTANSSACSTGTEAIIEGMQRIRLGLADRMLCGGTEGSSHYIWAGFDSMRVLCRTHNDEPGAASRPLSASAAGFIPGSVLNAPAVRVVPRLEARGFMLRYSARDSTAAGTGTVEA